METNLTISILDVLTTQSLKEIWSAERWLLKDLYIGDNFLS